MKRSLLTLLSLLGCAPAAEPLPTAAAVEAARAPAAALPTLAEALYDAPVAPAPTAAEQRVRLLLWLRRMELDRGQLDRLERLRLLALEQRARVEAAEREAGARFAAEAERVYGEIWAGLAAGLPPEDPALVALAGELDLLSAGGARERGVLTVRLEGVRLVLEAERELLDTLTELQRERLLEGLFALRRRLDPVGTPGDWDALVGPTFEVGAPGLLLRGSTQGIADPLDLGALWGEPAGMEGAAALPEARREAVLYLVLLQPGLDQAIEAARALAPQTR